MSTEVDSLRNYMRESGLTQAEWARLAGLKFWTVAKFVSQKKTDPRTSTFLALRKAAEQHRIAGAVA